jgi:hypothetical protein
MQRKQIDLMIAMGNFKRGKRSTIIASRGAYSTNLCGRKSNIVIKYVLKINFRNRNTIGNELSERKREGK